MTADFDAKTSVTIHAPATKVWQALVDPALIKQYLHGTDTVSDWRVGSPILWKGEWKGQPYEDKGTVLENVPNKLLKTTHWSPLGGSEDRPENYHTVTYSLEEKGGYTTLTLTQSNNATQQAADEMARNGWEPILKVMKEMVER
jgi:uncharacterized protein YndB with AHSA1/START domain